MSGRAPRALEEGDTVGAYVLGPWLGEGAAGTVFRAMRSTDGLEVALKLMKRALSSDAAFLARFKREARVAAEVRHRNLVPVVEFGEADGAAFIAGEFRDGGSLGDRITTESSIPLSECTRLACDIAAGIGALHNLQIVHRDIKPSNVMLDHTGTAAVTDFGLARGHAYTALTRPGQVLGTLDYMAPELIEGKEATTASDIYALGCLVYECVTGAPPFADRGIFEVAVAHLETDPPDPRERRDGVTDEYAWSVLRALQKDPADRPPTAIAYARLLSVSTPVESP